MLWAGPWVPKHWFDRLPPLEHRQERVVAAFQLSPLMIAVEQIVFCLARANLSLNIPGALLRK